FLGDQHARLLAPFAPLLPPSQALLRFSELLLRLAVVAWVLDRPALCRDKEDLQAHVDGRLLASGTRRLRGHIRTRGASVPAVRFPAGGDGFGGSVERALQADGDTPKLGPAEHAAVQDRTAARRRIGEGVVAATPLEAGRARRLSHLDAAEEGVVGVLHWQ